MASPAQAAANMANAQHSTGPRTDEGKASSSANSLKHGLTAQTVLLPGEDEAAYRKMCEGMFASFDPETTPENELVQCLCDTQWRLHRCSRIEAAILSADAIDFKALDTMSKHEARLKKQYSATLKEVRDLIEARIAQQEKDIREAMIIRRADNIDGRTTNLQDIGFVFSDEQVDAAIQADDALAFAKQVIAHHRFNSKAGYATVDNQKKQAQ